MRYLLLILGCFFISTSLLAEVDDILLLASGSGQQKTPEGQVFSKYLNGTPAEKTIFLQFVNEKSWKKCLYQWNAATTGSFRKTAVGRALFSFILLKNDMPLTGLEGLVALQAQQIPKEMWPLLKNEFGRHQKAWLYIASPWNSSWSPQISVDLQVLWRSHSLVGPEKAAEVSALLPKVTKRGWAYDWLVWQSTISHMLRGDNASASKNLSYLMRSKKSPVSKDLLNITAARLLYEGGFLKAAKSYYKKINSSSDFWPESVEEMAWQSMRMGKTREAGRVLKPLIKSDQKQWANVEAWYLKALSELRQKDFKSLDETDKAFTRYAQTRKTSLRQLLGSADTEPANTFISRAVQGAVTMKDLAGQASLLPAYVTRDLVLEFQVQAYKRFVAEADKARTLYQESLSQGTFQVGFEGFLKEFQQQAQSRSLRARSAALNRIQKLAEQEIQEIDAIQDKFTIVQAEVSQLRIN